MIYKLNVFLQHCSQTKLLILRSVMTVLITKYEVLFSNVSLVHGCTNFPNYRRHLRVLDSSKVM